LRGIAVLSVIFYHADVALFAGGYVGVDIFFAISGFLIFSLILHELSLGNFSFAHFYERRFKRLLPALFLMILCTTVASYFILIPQDFAAYSRSIIAASLYIPNLLFWRETGYFNHAADLNPLLHTWSLGVEEQFYAIAPVILLLIYRWEKRYLIPIFLLIALLSLLLAEFFVLNKHAAVFYLLPTRIWELLCGGLLALILSRHRLPPQNKIVAEIFMVLGIALISFAVFTFNRSTPVPSVYLLVPLFGTILILLFGTQQTIVGSILKSRLLVFLGLTSYSTYLWHQPILSLARYQSLGAPEPILIGYCVVGSFIIGALCWRYFELPIRRYPFTPKSKVFIFTLFATFIFVAFGVLGHLKNGFENRYTADFDRRQQEVWNSFMSKDVPQGECRYSLSGVNLQVSASTFEYCRNRQGPAVVILGDSHAMNFLDAFLINSNYPHVIGIAKGGCRPHAPLPECDFESIQRFISTNIADIKIIFYVQTGLELLLDRNNVPALPDFFSRNKNQIYSVNAENIEKVVNYLKSLGGDGKTVWLGPRFEPWVNANKMLEQALKCTNYNPDIISSEKLSIFLRLDQTLSDHIAIHDSLAYVSSLDAIKFDPSDDLYTCSEVFWTDGNHWSYAGAKRFGIRILDTLVTKKILTD
jgi:peptidoglycan/LPS O-acetylase OafA/YrhL